MTEEKGERSTLQGTVTKIVYQDPQGRYTVVAQSASGPVEPGQLALEVVVEAKYLIEK